MLPLALRIVGMGNWLAHGTPHIYHISFNKIKHVKNTNNDMHH